ncbi:MAG: hypothetical protein WDZ31_01580 [Phycisphaeraceae bacterium]
MLWLSRLVIAGLLAGLALVVAGCTEDGVEEAPPADRAREGLEQAEQSLEQLHARYDQLGQQIEQRQQLLREHMQTQLRLIDFQLQRFERETHHLPAEVETDLRDSLQQLAGRREQVEQSMNAYLSAAADEAPPRRAQFEQQLDALQQEAEQYEQQLMVAREQAMERMR